ncbi:unnamed protein product [Paramecium sonneborni]|uniref:Uncharacterized protein n=1 Tax=Paramecium sonneborni TaxID=65129 RepID=A0A8S1P378_9CILI|nr:unnamed protein product [Paramecium sonneborni]
MNTIYSVQNLNDDIEILDFRSNLRTCNIKIKNYADYILWEKKIEYFSNCLTYEKFTFGNKSNQINILSKGKIQQAELIIGDKKIILKNKDYDDILYQLQQEQKISLENVVKINQYSVNYDQQNQIIRLSDGLNIINSIQLTKSKQNLIINGCDYGCVLQKSDGSIQYIANDLSIFCGIKQNEELELNNFQNFQVGTTQLCIEYQFD